MSRGKKDPSDSPAIYPVLSRNMGFSWIWDKSRLVKAWFKPSISFMTLLYRREIFSPGFQAVDHVFMQDVHPCIPAQDLVCSYLADAHHSFTQSDYPGGTEGHESSHVVANQESAQTHAVTLTIARSYEHLPWAVLGCTVGLCCRTGP